MEMMNVPVENSSFLDVTRMKNEAWCKEWTSIVRNLPWDPELEPLIGERRGPHALTVTWVSETLH